MSDEGAPVDAVETVADHLNAKLDAINAQIAPLAAEVKAIGDVVNGMPQSFAQMPLAQALALLS